MARVSQVMERESCRWCGDCGVLAKPLLVLFPRRGICDQVPSPQTRFSGGKVLRVSGQTDWPGKWLQAPTNALLGLKRAVLRSPVSFISHVFLPSFCGSFNLKSSNLAVPALNLPRRLQRHSPPVRRDLRPLGEPTDGADSRGNHGLAGRIVPGP